MIDTTRFRTYREEGFTYKKIVIDSTHNYVLSGYFQSYKYFWEHRHAIKEYLYISPDLLHRIRAFKGDNRIIAIHIRLGDYLLNPDYHCVQEATYYKNILTNLDVSHSTILLFSDDIEKAKEYLVAYTYRTAEEFSANDEDQLLLMSHCDVIIGASSTYSLMSVYLNEMYQFNPTAVYYFPDQWFGKQGPHFRMEDLVPQ